MEADRIMAFVAYLLMWAIGIYASYRAGFRAGAGMMVDMTEYLLEHSDEVRDEMERIRKEENREARG